MIRVGPPLRVVQVLGGLFAGGAILPHPSSVQLWIAVAAVAALVGSVVRPDSLAGTCLDLAVVACWATGDPTRPIASALIPALGLAVHHSATAALATCPTRTRASQSDVRRFLVPGLVLLALSAVGWALVAITDALIPGPLPAYVAAIGVVAAAGMSVVAVQVMRRRG